MLDLIFLNLRYIGYAAVLLGIVWLANFLLDLYYNIAIVHKCWNCRTFYDGVLRFGAVCHWSHASHGSYKHFPSVPFGHRPYCSGGICGRHVSTGDSDLVR